MASALVCLPILIVLRLAPLKLTGLLPANEVKGSYKKWLVFLTGKPPEGGLPKLGLAPSDSFNFHASLHQERSAKWSKRDSFGSHKSPAAPLITEHCSDNHYRLPAMRLKCLWMELICAGRKAKGLLCP